MAFALQGDVALAKRLASGFISGHHAAATRDPPRIVRRVHTAHKGQIAAASRIGVDPLSGILRRHHRHSSTIQRVVKNAIRSCKLRRKASCHTFRHSFATRLIETGYDIKLVQSLLGHRDIRTTEIYLHVGRKRTRMPGGVGANAREGLPIPI